MYATYANNWVGAAPSISVLLNMPDAVSDADHTVEITVFSASAAGAGGAAEKEHLGEMLAGEHVHLVLAEFFITTTPLENVELVAEEVVTGKLEFGLAPPEGVSPAEMAESPDVRTALASGISAGLGLPEDQVEILSVTVARGREDEEQQLSADNFVPEDEPPLQVGATNFHKMMRRGRRTKRSPSASIRKSISRASLMNAGTMTSAGAAVQLEVDYQITLDEETDTSAVTDLTANPAAFVEAVAGPLTTSLEEAGVEPVAGSMVAEPAVLEVVYKPQPRGKTEANSMSAIDAEDASLPTAEELDAALGVAVRAHILESYDALLSVEAGVISGTALGKLWCDTDFEYASEEAVVIDATSAAAAAGDADPTAPLGGELGALFSDEDSTRESGELETFTAIDKDFTAVLGDALVTTFNAAGGVDGLGFTALGDAVFVGAAVGDLDKLDVVLAANPGPEVVLVPMAPAGDDDEQEEVEAAGGGGSGTGGVLLGVLIPLGLLLIGVAGWMNGGFNFMQAGKAWDDGGLGGGGQQPALDSIK
eukprot:g7158.t1